MLQEITSALLTLPSASPAARRSWITDPSGLLTWMLLVVVAFGAAWIGHRVLYVLLARILPEPKLVRFTKTPARVLLLLVFLRWTLATLGPGFTSSDSYTADIETTWLQRLFVLALIASATWLIIGLIAGADDLILRKYKMDVRDNRQARRMHTQVRVIARTLMIIVGLIGGAAALMTFESVRQFGLSLLASAGIAGLILGLAARPTFENIIAGIQIALTQPITLDDAVVVEGEWGWVEEITATYVVVKIWDERRLIVPFKRFIEQPFQNWTRKTADIIGTVLVHCDYSVPVEEVRAELKRLCEASDKWDKRVCVLQVTEAGPRELQLRALVSAADSPTAWDLRCEIREQLVAFIRDKYPGALPRVRAELEIDEEAP